MQGGLLPLTCTLRGTLNLQLARRIRGGAYLDTYLSLQARGHGCFMLDLIAYMEDAVDAKKYHMCASEINRICDQRALHCGDKTHKMLCAPLSPAEYLVTRQSLAMTCQL